MELAKEEKGEYIEDYKDEKFLLPDDETDSESDILEPAIEVVAETENKG